MDVQEAIYNARTIRTFHNKKVPREVINEILQAGVQAPSSCNQQLFKFILIEDQDVKRRLKDEATFRHIDRIPNPMFVILDGRFNKENNAHLQGTSATIQNMILYAYSLGIGAWWINGYGDRETIKKILSIPKYYLVVCALGFGYPAETPLKPKKQNISKITYIDKFGGVETASKNPNHWDYDEIVELTERAIAAKSPEIGYYPLFPIQADNEVAFMGDYLGKNTLSVFEISGIFLFLLAKKYPSTQFTAAVTGKIIADWIDKRAEYLKLSNVKATTTNLGDLPAHEYDSVLYLDCVNRLPMNITDQLIVQSHHLLKKDGNLVINNYNRYSIYGFLSRKGAARRYGPEMSLPPTRIEQHIKDAHFSIVKKRGFSLIPSLVFVTRKKVPAEFEKYAKFLRWVSKFRMLENVNSKSLRKICTSSVIVAQPK